MPHYNLPPFADGRPTNDEGNAQKAATFAAADRRGEWLSARGSLSELGSSLRVTGGGGVDDVKSAPDPWAQLITFVAAIATHNHSLKAETRRQWRGLLSLFALEKARENSYALVVRSVDLSGGSRLERVLSALLPNPRLPQAVQPTQEGSPRFAEWSRPAILELKLVEGQTPSGQRRYGDSTAIGVLNPGCLVAAGRRTAQLAFPSIPWMKNGLCDPTELEGEDALPLIQLAMLREYALGLRYALNELAGGTQSDLLTAVAQELDLFARDCVAKGAANCPIEVKLDWPRADPQLPPLYHLMRRDVVAVEPADPAAVSECLIALRPDLGAKAPFKGIILVDREVARTRRKFARDVVVWGVKTLAEVDGHATEMASLRKAAAARGYFVATRDDFFTRNLIRLGRSAVIPGQGEALKDAVLPLSPLVLLAAKAEDLSSQITIEDESGVRQTARLTLTLSASRPAAEHLDGAPAVAHALTRSFAPEPAAGQGRLVSEGQWSIGDVSVWPDFAHSDWPWYFARLTHLKTVIHNPRGRFATSGRALAEMLAPLDGELREKTFRPWCSPEPFAAEPLEAIAPLNMTSPWMNRIRCRENSGFATEIESSPYPFEAIFFTTVDEMGGATIPAGLVILKPRMPTTGGDNGTVAIDFGTTNTVASFNNGEPIVFKDRLLFPITSSDPGVVTRGTNGILWHFVDFMPLSARSTPTPTVVLDRQIDRGPGLDAIETLDDDRMLFSNIAYFHPDTAVLTDGENLVNKELLGILGRTRFNLKWSEEPLARRASHRFLRQLMLMIAAEAFDGRRNLKTLKWRFSRPDSMEDHKDFGDQVKAKLAEIIPDALPDAVQPLCSEGISAANYVLSRGGDREFVAGHLNVVMDIGGGTTDVAIWVDNALVWSGSYRIAGGAYFTSHLVNNPEFLKRFGLGNWRQILDREDAAAQQIDSSVRLFVGELLFSGPTLEQALNAGWADNSGTAEVKNLNRTAFVFLGGMAWYLGLVARGLIAQGRLDSKALDSVAFALCGRGAGLFARLHGKDAGSDSEVSRLLRLFAMAARAPASAEDGAPETTLPERPSVIVSPTPKLEVVKGMVITDGVVDVSARPEAHPYEPVGLATPFGGEILAAEADIAPAPQGAPGRPDMAGLQAFLDALAETSRFTVDITAGGRQSSSDGIASDVLAALQKGRGRIVEPPFITALRSLVADMASRDRDKRLAVKESGPSGRR